MKLSDRRAYRDRSCLELAAKAFRGFALLKSPRQGGHSPVPPPKEVGQPRLWCAGPLLRSLAAVLPALLFLLCLCAADAAFAAQAPTPLAQLEKRLAQEKRKAAERKKSLSRMTEQERKLNADLAAAEKRILEIEQGIASQQARLLELGTADDEARKEYEYLQAEQEKTQQAQAETLRLLWEVTAKRMAAGNRDLPGWETLDREYAWSGELFAALDRHRKEIDGRAEKLMQVLGKRNKLSRDMQARIQAVNAEKTRLLKSRLEYDRQLAELRKKRTDTEAELDNILSLVENLNIEITKRADDDIAALKGRLKYPVSGTVRLRYAPQAVPASRGLSFAAADKAEVRSVAQGKVVHNGVLRGFGTVLIVQHGEDYFSLYAFLGNSPLQVGQDVTRGQKIGTVGYYPALKGPGLYFELRFKKKAINPEPWFAT